MDIEKKEGEHGKLVLRGYLKSEERTESLPNEAIRVCRRNSDGTETPLFGGIIQDAHIFIENGVTQIILTASTNDIQLDIEKKKRSFQETSAPYNNILENIIEPYHGSIIGTNISMPIKAHVIQYEETDWEFCRRMAARMGAVIFSNPGSNIKKRHIGIPV